MLGTSKKPGPTRKYKSDSSVLQCWTALENLGPLEKLNLTPQFHAKTCSQTPIFWSLEKYDYTSMIGSNLSKKGSLESTGAVTSSFHVPQCIFSLETDVLTGGLTYLVFWGKLERGCSLPPFLPPFLPSFLASPSQDRIPKNIPTRRNKKSPQKNKPPMKNGDFPWLC